VGLNACFWASGLRSLGSAVALSTVLGASARTLLARWVPGSLWYAAGRSAVLARGGVPVAALTTVAGLEMALSLLVGLVMGVGLLAISGRLPQGIWWLAPPLAVLAALMVRPLVNRVLRWWAQRRGVEPLALPGRGYLALVAWTAVFWLWASLTFVSYLAAFPGLDAGSPVAVAGAYMVAWCVGFVTPIAPQGLGVFEVTLAAILGIPDLGAGSIIVAGFRLVTLARDIIATAWGEAGAARRRAGQNAGPERPG
jgi:hypothetical protein